MRFSNVCVTELLHAINTINPDYTCQDESDVIMAASYIILLQAEQIKDLCSSTATDDEALDSLALGPSFTVNIAGDVVFNLPEQQVTENKEETRSIVQRFAQDINLGIDMLAEWEEEEYRVDDKFWQEKNPYYYQSELCKTAKHLIEDMDNGCTSEISRTCAQIAAYSLFISAKAGDLEVTNKTQGENND